jgi:PAS domain S-box-containing protein
MNLLTSNMDYLYFVYGLSYILLGIQCVRFDWRRNENLPWTYLALFAFIHGINEWLNVLSFTLGEVPELRLIKFGLATISFVSLFEFGRRGISRNGGYHLSNKIYVPLFAILFYTVFIEPQSNWSAISRYLFALPGGLLAAWTFWVTARNLELGSKLGLRLAALALSIYGIGISIFVPPASFFPSNWLNSDSFFNFTGISIQLIKTICSTAIVFGFWFHYKLAISIEKKYGIFQRWLIPAALVSLIIAGWFAVRWRASEVDQNLRRELLRQTTQIANSISPELVKALSFTSQDRQNPAYQCLCEQLKAYGKYAGLSYIYSLKYSNGAMLFGPETLDINDPLSSAPGTVYQKPPPLLMESAYKNRESLVIGPYTDEYGNFVSSFAPVMDQNTGDVSLIIGMDVAANRWLSQIAQARLIAILFILGLALLLAASIGILDWRQRLMPERQKPYSQAEIAFTIIAGLVLTTVFVLTARENELKSKKQLFMQLADTKINYIKNYMTSVDDQLSFLGANFAVDEIVSREEFKHYVHTRLMSVSERAYEWIPRVAFEDKSAIEKQAQKDGIAGFRIYEKDFLKRNSPVSPRSVYYPVYYVEPMQGNEPALGYDLGSEKIRRAALLNAEESGFSTATDPIVLVQEKIKHDVILIFHPVFENRENISRKPADIFQDSKIIGFTVAVINLDRMLSAAVSNFGLKEPDVCIDMFQLSPNGPDKMVSSFSNGRLQGVQLLPESMHYDNENIYSNKPIFIFGRAYLISAYPGSDFIKANPSRNGWIALVIGLIFTVIVTLFVGYLRNRQISLEKTVRARTAELAESETKYRNLIESSSDAIMVLEPPLWNYSSGNQAALRIFGVDNLDAFTARSPFDFSPAFQLDGKPSIEKGKEYIEHALRKGSCQFEWKHNHLGGDDFYADVLLTRIEQPDKVLVQATVRDISERKKAEEELIFRNTLLLTQQEASIDGILIVDENNKVLSHNRKFIEMWGVPEELRSVEDDEPLLKYVISQVSEPALFLRRVVYLYKHRTESSQDELALKDGRVFDRYSAPVFGPEKQYFGRIWYFRDITERKAAEIEKDKAARLHQNISILQQGLLSMMPLNEKLTSITDGIILAFDATICRIWVIQPGDRCEFDCVHSLKEDISNICRDHKRCLHLMASSIKYVDSDDKAQSRIPFGESDIGLVASGRYHKIFTNNVQEDSRFHDNEWARQQGLVSFAGYQLRISGGTTLGVLAIYSKRSISPLEDSMLDSISSSVALVIQQAQTEETLRHSEDKYRMLIEGSRDAITTLELFDWKFTSGNQAAIDMFRVNNAAEITAFSPCELSPEKQPDGILSSEKFKLLIDKALTKGFCNFEWAHRRITGEEFFTDVLLTRMEQGGKVFIQAIIRDITERKRMMEALTASQKAADLSREQLIQSDKLAAIGTLAAGVAHEINNPMGYISSNLNTMKKYLDNFEGYLTVHAEENPKIKLMLDDFRDAINESAEGATRVKRIVSDLKSFSRVDRLHKEYANLNAGIDSTLNIVWNELKYKCKVEKDYGVLPDFYCMANQLNQVFMNLLVNAGQAIDKEDGLIKIKTWADNKAIHISFSDNGCGIPAENLNRIFEAFFTTKKIGEGTGLGLSLVYDIISKHDGKIEVKSQVGVGTEFQITLPMTSNTSSENRTKAISTAQTQV